MGIADDFSKGYGGEETAEFDLPPEIRNEYEIKACLKRSREKQVYLAVSNVNWKKYIIKAVAQECQERLEEEYGLSQALSHSGIVKARAFIEGTGFNYLIREYLEGNTVTERVEMTREGRLPREEVLRITAEVCDILRYLHSQTPPIIHRDIKPDNIIVTEQGDCKLIDFGISRRLHKDNKSDTVVMGSQFSAPPEQYGFAQTDERSDIYSLGMLIYYMITGGMDIRDLESYSIPADIKGVIIRCTRFSPVRRYSSVRQLKRKLQKLSMHQEEKHRYFVKAAGLTLIFGVFLMGLLYQGGAPVSEESKGQQHVQNKVTEEAGQALTENAGEAIKGAENSVLLPEAKPLTPQLTSESEPSSLPASEPGPSSVLAASEPELSSLPASQPELSSLPASEPEPSSLPASQSGSPSLPVSEPELSSLPASQQEISSTADKVSIPYTAESSEVESVRKKDSQVGEEGTYYFRSPLIETAVRDVLGKSDGETVTREELRQISELYICGQQIYRNWNEHFVYGKSQYMVVSKYNETGLFQKSGGITGLEDISLMENLQTLDLYNQEISDLTPLKELHNLQRLGLGRNKIEDLTPLLSLESLSYLDLSGNPITNADIGTLTVLPSLSGLDLGETNVNSIYSIRTIPLKYLSVFECRIGNCEGLEQMTKLETFITTGVNNMITEEAVDRIALLKNLKELRLMGCFDFDIIKLEKNTCLEYIDFCGARFDCIGSWHSPSIKTLMIDFIPELDLAGVENFPNVTYLSLRDSSCTDYTPLLKLKNLKTVNCNEAQSREIKAQLGAVPFEIVY